MTKDLHVTDLIPAYVLGALDGDEARWIAEHLAACSVCRETLVQYEMVMTELAYTAPQTEPSPAVKQKLMARVRAADTPAPVPPIASLPQNSWWNALLTLFKPMPRSLIAAAVVLAIVAGVWWFASPQKQPVPAGQMQTVALLGTDAAPDSEGVMIIGADGRDGAVVVEHLPPLDETHQYQLWLIKNGKRTSGAVFSVDEEGYGVAPVRPGRPLTDFSAFGITIEPAGGSPAPTGQKVLGGSL